MDKVLSYLMICVELLSLYVVLDIWFEQRIKQSWIYAGALVGASVCMLTVQQFIVFDNVYIKAFLAVTIFSWTVNIFFIGNFLKKLAVVCAYYMFLLTIDSSVMMGIMYFCNASIQNLMENKIIWTIAGVMSKVLLLSICLILRRKMKSKQQKYSLPMMHWMLILIVPLGMILNMCLVVFYAIRDNRINIWVIVDVIILTVGNVLYLFLEEKLEQERSMEILNSELEQRIKSGKEQAEVLLNNFQEQRKLTHDFRNQLLTLEGLLKNKDYEVLEEYLENLLQSNIQIKYVLYTGHPIIDAILNREYQVAKDQGIMMEFKLSNLEGIPLSNDEVVVLLTNLLDNAIEASSKVKDEKRIIVQITYEKSQLVISVCNRACEIKIQNNHLLSTKEDKLLHGFGLQNVERVLEDRGYDYAMNYNKGWFQFTIIIS